jgi:hypothetical protein
VWPKVAQASTETQVRQRLGFSNMVLLQRDSCLERVTGIEPALSAWEEFLSRCVSVSCNDIGGLR